MNIHYCGPYCEEEINKFYHKNLLNGDIKQYVNLSNVCRAVVNRSKSQEGREGGRYDMTGFADCSVSPVFSQSVSRSVCETKRERPDQSQRS